MQPDTVGILVAVGIVVLLAVIAGIWTWSARTTLVARRTRADDAWSDIRAQLTRRGALLPDLVEAVRGYATHESAAFDRLLTARDETTSATTPAQASAAEAHVQTALKAVFAVAESYPQLLSSQSFLRLQSELVETEDGIQAARRSYNGSVRELNAGTKSFPAKLFARGPAYAEREFFEVSQPSAIAEPPRVQF